MKENGFSLIELMIALSIGIMVSGAVIHIFIHSTITMKMQQDVVDMQQSGRVAFDILQDDIRKVGYGIEPAHIGDKLVYPLDTTNNIINATLDSGNSTVAVNAKTLPSLLLPSDQLRMSYKVPDASISSLPMSNCAGTIAEPGAIIVNTYYVAADSSPTVSALACTGVNIAENGTRSSTQTVYLVRSVVSFQVLLGQEAEGTDPSRIQSGLRKPTRYVLPGSAQGGSISSVRIHLVLRSAQAKNTTPPLAKSINAFEHILSPEKLMGEGGKNYIYRSFTSTIALANRVSGR